jgi:hypothetical protein
VPITQTAPDADALAGLVDRLSYRDGWQFLLVNELDRGQGSKGTTLVITVTTPDSYDASQVITVNHYMPVPPASFDERSWRWWLFQQVSWVEQHERMEFFRIDGKPAYPPAHGPGNDPYLILDYGSDTDRRTSFRGELNPE